MTEKPRPGWKRRNSDVWEYGPLEDGRRGTVMCEHIGGRPSTWHWARVYDSRGFPRELNPLHPFGGLLLAQIAAEEALCP